MAKMNHTPTAMPEADQYDCALTERIFIISQHEGMGRKDLHSVL